MSDEPDPNRRLLIGLACGLPFIGGAAELVVRAGRHRMTREAAQIPARAFIDPQDERQLPLEKIAAEAVSDRQDEHR